MEPSKIGTLFVTFFWTLLLVGGIIKCYRIAKRNTTCSKCVYGLLATLTAMLIGFSVYFLKSFKVSSPGLTFIFVTIWFILLITGIVLSIIGLVEYKQHEEFTQGRKQAITAIVLSVLFVGLLLFGFYRNITRRGEIPKLTRIERTPGTIRIFEDFNFKYKFPDKPWVEMDAKKVNPYAVFTMINAPLKIFFMIIAEKAGVEMNMESSTLAEISRGYLKSMANEAHFSNEKSYKVNELKGIRYNGDAVVANRHFSYVYWVCSHNGYLYQLVTFGDTKNRRQIQEVAGDLLTRFEQLEKNKVIYSTSSAPYGTFTSEKFNYTVNLRNTHWLKWKNLEKDFPEAETGGLLANGSWFSVIPFYYGNQSPSLEALRTILLQYVNVDLPGKTPKNLTPLKESGLIGCRFHVHANVDGTNYVYYNKVVKGKKCGFLLTFVTDEGNPQRKTLANQLFDAVAFHSKGASHEKRPAETLAALTGREKESHSSLYNQLGLFYFNAKQYQKCLPLFKIAVQLNPKDHVYIENILETFFQLKKYNQGLSYLETLGPLLKEDKTIRSWKAAYLAHLNRTEDAIAVFEKLFAENYRNDDDFISYIRLLTEQEQWDRGAVAFEKYLQQGDSLKLRLEQARMLFKQEKFRDSIKLLKIWQRQGSFNVEIAYALIENYKSLKDYKSALAVCEHIIAEGFASRDAYYEKGLVEFELKRYRKAKKSFETALSYSPNDKNIQEDIKFVSGLLGEGDNTLLKDAITVVSIPDEVARKLPPLTAPSPQEGYSAYYISKVVGIEFRGGKGTKFTTYDSIKVLDANGVSRFSTLQFVFDPLSEQIFVNRLIVLDQEGKVISRGRPADYYVLDNQTGEMATHDRTLHIPVPHLQPGYTIQLTLTIERLGKGEEFRFYSSTLSSYFPIVFSARYVMGDVNRLLYRTTAGVKAVPFQDGMLWYTENPPVYHWEPEPAVYSNYLPMVWLNDGSLTWQGVGSKYLELEAIREKLEMEPQVKTLARQLTKGMNSKREKIDALAQYIQKRYTYKAIEFGRRALIPNKASQIITNKYGDCKDHAFLFHQMLKAVDIPSYLALVNFDAAVKPEMPSLDQFNHMILYIPGNKEEGGGFIDTTDKGLDLRMHVPSNLGGKQALVLNPGNIELIKIPGYEAGSSTILIQKDIQMVNEKEMKIRETLQINGYAASLARSYFKKIESRKHLEWAHRLIRRYLDSSELETIDMKNLHDNTKPLMLELDYKVTNRTRTPNAWESYYLEVTSVKKRKTPFRISHPFILKSNCSLKAPAGFTIDPQGDYNKVQNGQAPFAQWESFVRSAPRELNLYLQCTLVPGEYGANRYSQFSNMMGKAAKSMAVEFNCRK